MAKQLAEVTAFQEVIQARLRPLSDHLNELEEEILSYKQQLGRLRNRRLYDENYPTVDEQFREIQDADSTLPTKSKPVPRNAEDKMQIKRLYHRLARKFHPDLAQDNSDEAERTDRMAALNEAYAAGSIAELMALSDASAVRAFSLTGDGRTQEMLIESLEIELSRINRRLIEVEVERKNLHNHPVVQLSLQVKMARLKGENLLSEMAVDLERRIEEKAAERDRLKAELEQFGTAPEDRPRKKQTSPLARRIRARSQRSNHPQPSPSPKAG